MVSSAAAAYSVAQFQHKWRGIALKERSASQPHFTDLCRMLGVPTPTDADPTGTFYTFEKGAEKTEGGDGWADVWFRGHFAWEYKGRHADLKKAYAQLQQYREALENPPLLVVCDLDRFEIHTNFTGTAKKVYAFGLDELHDPDTLAILRALWSDPNRLRPDTRRRPSRGRRRNGSGGWRPACTGAGSRSTRRWAMIAMAMPSSVLRHRSLVRLRVPRHGEHQPS